MSGTSLDGADAVVVDLSSPTPIPLAFASSKFDVALRAELLALNTPGSNEVQRCALAANALADVYADVTRQVVSMAGLAPKDIVAIGCHGQTIRHRPDHGFTLQLNNAARLAAQVGIDVVSDFRVADVANGGQGAPLAPAFHDGVFRSDREHRVVVNIGGIANITVLTPGEPVWGFDCGPGNCLMDLWVATHLGKPFDDNGVWASQGRVIESMLLSAKREPYFELASPKSTGRDLFNRDWLQAHLPANAAPVDVMATLLELTAWSISVHLLRTAPHTSTAIICGGGANNTTLMAGLGRHLPGVTIRPSEAFGVPAQQVEALAFGWLAQQFINGIALDLRRTTGARKPSVLGSLVRA